ncbi:hypothetical protein BGW80DRAFT_1270329 [Lactifluus volemus]|nr:hypothetical protein BGW80DRAFT_1270329 [Lactifluus volemus]
MTSVASIPVYMLPGAPVLQPPRSALETGDPNLATEVLPAPPTLSSVLQASSKRDPRKPVPTMSYLPQHDPGTTYAGVLTGPIIGSLESIPEVDGPRRKRVRLDKGSFSQLAQRGTSRRLNTPPQGFPNPDALEHMATGNWDPEFVSRASSVAFPEDTPPASKASRTKEKGKGKGKERDTDKMVSRVKEEPLPAALPLFNGLSSARNEDHCSACRSLGSLVYCDGCTRAYHLWCLDPPMEAADIPEGESRWFCPSCEVHQTPPSMPPPSLLSPLIHHVLSSPPVEFQLPEDIRTFFKFVGSNPRGHYVDTSLIKAPRLNRYGQMEYRDPYRTKDKNGAPVLCFRCGTSALPPPMFQDVLPWRSIVSCDYCPLHWHLDCLSPPLLAMPPLDKKWMCPNHVDHTLRIKHRIPRQNPVVIDIERPGRVNNGNIEILDTGTSSPLDKVAVDEVFINGKRYRIPERVIKLDFWDKVHSSHGPTQRCPSVPLTSLSSLDGEENETAKNPLEGMGVEDVRLALMLLDMAHSGGSTNGSSPPTASQQSAQALTADPYGCPDGAILSVPTCLESNPSGTKSAEGNAERKQPARASKRDITFSAIFLESNGSDDEDGAPSLRRPAPPRERQRKAPRVRRPRSQPRPSQAARVAKGEPLIAAAAPANCVTPAAPVTQSSPQVSAGEHQNPTVTPSSFGQGATPTLKIRLPRFSLTSKSTPASPVQVRTGERPRRSRRRQTSTTGSSSTSVSKADGRGSAAESPRE